MPDTPTSIFAPEPRASGHSNPDRAVIVVGGGPVGLASALALADAGVETLLITAPPPPAGTGAQARSAALFAPALALLDRLGVFATVRPRSAPLTAIRLIDDTGGLLRAPEVVFRAREIGAAEFGWNVPNGALAEALTGRLMTCDGPLTWVRDGAITRVIGEPDAVRVILADGRSYAGALVVAADGRGSVCRVGAGIGVETWDYDQVAITANFSHRRPHGGISTEFHRDCGPCTTVPLPGAASALVWVERPPVAARLLALDDRGFADALEARLQGLLGVVEEVGPRGRFALSALRARRCAAQRVMLAGEALHVMPPIGAQGLNLGLRDVGCLVDCITDAVADGRDPGGADALAAYERARAGDVAARMTAVDMLNRSLLTELLPVQLARGFGLHVLAGFGPLRRRLMAEGIGAAASLPRLMRPLAAAGQPGAGAAGPPA